MKTPFIVVAALAIFLSGGAYFAGWYGAQPRNESVVLAPARAVDVAEIGLDASDVRPPIAYSRKANKRVLVNLKATQVVAALDNGTTYEYWTYNNTVPGPFIRAMEGDEVEVRLTHEHAHGDTHAKTENIPFSFEFTPFADIALADGGHDDSQGDGHGAMTPEMAEHAAAGHGEHSIDLHAVIGPGGGAGLMRVGPNESKSFVFKATRPGIYVYHCASPHIPTHVANGMYGLILVEPAGGLSPADREFYVMQGELYTSGEVGAKGHQEFDAEKLKNGAPEYFVFNGRVGSLTGTRALRAKTGEKIRLFFGVGSHIASNFHVIGGVLDKLYPEGDILSPPHRNVQTTLVPAGGAMMAEFSIDVPGKYLLVDHNLPRAIDRGAVGELIIEGPARPDLISKAE